MNDLSVFEHMAIDAHEAARALEPVHTCPVCKRDDLIASDLVDPSDKQYEWAVQAYGVPTCKREFCCDLAYLDVTNPPPAPTEPRVKCPKCSGRGQYGSEFHYVREASIRNDCPLCDGEGFLAKEHAEGLL